MTEMCESFSREGGEREEEEDFLGVDKALYRFKLTIHY